MLTLDIFLIGAMLAADRPPIFSLAQSYRKIAEALAVFVEHDFGNTMEYLKCDLRRDQPVRK
jgi:hypothetical protein